MKKELLSVIMAFIAMIIPTKSWAQTDDLEIYAVQTGATIVPNEAIVTTPSVRMTPGNDTAWNTEYSIAIDHDSSENTIDFIAGIYYPNNLTSQIFRGSMYGTNDPKDGKLVDGASSGSSYQHYLKNLPNSGGYVVFEPQQDGSLIVPIHVGPAKQFYVVDGYGKAMTDIQIKDASGQTLSLMASPLCALSSENSTTAFASFNVKQGEKYYMFCRGSKMRFGGYVFSKQPIEIDSATMSNVKRLLDAEPYAVLSDNNVLTFYFDDQKTARRGMDINTSWIDNDTSTSPYGTATTAVIDASFADYMPTSTENWFRSCPLLTSISGLENLKTDSVTSMYSMFGYCSSLTSLDVSGFKTDNVTEMSGMFYNCSGLKNLDVSGFNTAKVTTMNTMFTGCSGLTSLDVSGFNTSNVTDMNFMFDGCYNLTNLDVSGFNTSNVTTMGYMFANCYSLSSLDVTGFDTSNMRSLVGLFMGCSGLTDLDVSRFETSKVGSMYGLFNGCSGLTSLDLSNFNTANATSMRYMFSGCSSLVDLNISSFNTANVPSEYLNDLFTGCSNLASIQAGSANIPAEEYARIGNPNLLVYVNDASLAPQGIQNIVVNGVAKHIMLTDVESGNNNFFCPEAFTAHSIIYTHDFWQQTEPGISRGWEGIALPFDVQVITHWTKGEITPFGATDNNSHFWLRSLSPNGLTRATSIKAYTPYIISMPNNAAYTTNSNLNGIINFEAYNTVIPATPVNADMSVTSGIYTMVPTYQAIAQGDSIYAINIGQARGNYAEGSVFEQGLREVRPFEVYTLHNGGNARPRYIPIDSQTNGEATDIDPIGCSPLIIDPWYSLDGRKLFSVPKAKGIYIQNGKKKIVR